MPNPPLYQRLATISAITLTPFHPETREVDWPGVEQNARFLVDNGVKVVVPCGNTSEFYALTLEEAKAEVRAVVKVAAGRAVVMAGIGYAAKTAIELGRSAQEAGADCVMIHQPVHPYITEPGAIAYFREIIEALDIPSIIYFRDPQMSDRVLVELSQLEKLVGVKYAVNDLPRFAKLVRDVPAERGVTWLCGTAEKWAPFFYQAGAKGFTSGLVNVYPSKSFEMLKALQTGDYDTVWKVWTDVLPFENLRAKYNNGINVAVVKEALDQLGGPPAVTRDTVAALDEADRAEVGRLLRQWKLLV